MPFPKERKIIRVAKALRRGRLTVAEKGKLRRAVKVLLKGKFRLALGQFKSVVAGRLALTVEEKKAIAKEHGLGAFRK